MWKSDLQDERIKVTYLFHSGVALEFAGCIVIIDYYQPADFAEILRPEVERLLRKQKKIYVLVSHAHSDHFDPIILTWSKLPCDITYIFSEDIRRQLPFQMPVQHFMKKGDTYQDDCLFVRAYGSTDQGVSFYLEVGAWKLFHAGDLNNWHWNEESTEEEIEQSESDFLRELADIEENCPELDLVCFPIDRRLGKDYMRGAEQFLSRIRVHYFVPIHFTSGRFSSIVAFRPIAACYGATFWEIKKECDNIIINKTGT